MAKLSFAPSTGSEPRWALHKCDASRSSNGRTGITIRCAIVHRLTNGVAIGGCLGELQEAVRSLDRAGFGSRPDWVALRNGARPPVTTSAEPGEWQHGWQCNASSTSEHHFRETMVLSPACPSDRAHLRSHSGPGSSGVLLGAPTGREYRVLPEHFRTVVLERLRVPLQLVEARCECGAVLDTYGRHRAACPRSGRLKRRAVPPEKTLARICREVGATVRFNAKLRDMNVAVAPWPQHTTAWTPPQPPGLLHPSSHEVRLSTGFLFGQLRQETPGLV